MLIKIYSTPQCPWCVVAKNYFKKKNIEFTDFNVAIDPLKAQEMIKLSGKTSVPVIVIDSKVISGFDQEEIEKTMAEKK